MSIEDNQLKNILEAALMAVGKPMNMEQLMTLFSDDDRPSATRIKSALTILQDDCNGRGIELKEVSSGYRYQARQDYAEWLSRLWEERAPKYSRAYLETLALIAYRQPVTRAEIEEVRGVSVSSNIMKTMLERDWIRVVGHRDVPGRPSLYATTRQFLDYFNMKSLDELPSLAEIRDLEDLSPELDLPNPDYASDDSHEETHLDYTEEVHEDSIDVEIEVDIFEQVNDIESELVSEESELDSEISNEFFNDEDSEDEPFSEESSFGEEDDFEEQGEVFDADEEMSSSEPMLESETAEPKNFDADEDLSDESAGLTQEDKSAT